MNRSLLKLLVPGFVLVVVAFVWAVRFVEPAPPRSFTLAAGPQDGAYLAFAEQYRQLLAAEGITVHVLETAGSVENVQRLADAEQGVDVAFVQTGVPVPPEGDIEGLAALYYEPLWLFSTGDEPVRQFGELRGRRVAIGTEGSGTRFVVTALLREHGMDESDLQALALGGLDALAALANDEVDAVFTVGRVDSPLVQELIHRPNTQLARLDMAEALSRRMPFLELIRLPRGLLDPTRDIPSEEIVLVSPVASLVARHDFHPALADLLLSAARTLHASGDLLSSPDRFPAASPTAAPLSKEADRFFSSGLPFLKRVLPFWAATLVARMWVMIIPLLTILIPLFKIIPPTYQWRLRSQLLRLYRRLKAVDAERLRAGGEVDAPALLRQIEDIEREVEELSVPLSYADRVYQLKVHIRFVREQLAGPAP